MKEQLQSFYQSLDSLNVRGVSIKEKRGEILKDIEAFKEKIEKTNSKDLESKNQEISAFIDEHLAQMKDRIKAWDSFTQKESKQEVFRERLQNAFIVVIYGKVKAGKSSLGNFIARHCLEHQKPKFTSYEKVGENVSEKNIDKFAEGITECTSEIQLFELGGMACVDTPGLCSMTAENGDLAKQYIDAADFIIFPTSSDAPAQNDELEQIKELVAQSKGECIQFLITKSDRSEEDEVNGELVKLLSNKPQKDRQRQEEDFKNRLIEWVAKHHLESEIQAENVFSISVLTAQKGLENNDEALFAGSNIPQFYKTMQEIVENKAQELKKQSPYNTLIGFIDTILENKEGLEPIRQSLEKLKQDKQKREQECEKIFRQLQTETLFFIDNCVSGKEIDTNNIKKAFKSIRHTIEKELRKKVAKATQEIIGGLELEFKAFELDTEVRTYRHRYKKDKGILENIANLFAGAISFGMWEPFEDEYGSIPTGNNLTELISKNTALFKSHYKEALQCCHKNIIEDLLNPYQIMLEHLSATIKRLENTLKHKKESLAKEIQ